MVLLLFLGRGFFFYLFLIIVLSYLFIGWRGFLPTVIPGDAHCSQEVDSMRERQGAQEIENTLSDHLEQVQQVIQRELPVLCERHLSIPIKFTFIVKQTHHETERFCLNQCENVRHKSLK